MTTHFEVAAADGGARLDTFVARVTGTSARAARILIQAGDVRVGGRRAVKGMRLQAGDQVEVALTHAVAPAGIIEPRLDVTLAIIYEDDDIVAIDKPVGMPSHPLKRGEGPSAAAALVARFPGCADAADDPREGGLGHRLDRGTGGVLIAAKHKAAWRALRRTLSGAGATKSYLAEVVGIAPPRQIINAPIGHGGPRGGTARVGAGRGMLSAETVVEPIARRERTSLVRATLSAGRQHQVRVHLAHVGLPILGDDRYGDEASRLLSGAMLVDGPRLFAESVTLNHPVTGARLRIEAPPPTWAQL